MRGHRWGGVMMGLILVSGCSPKTEEPNVVSLEGKVIKVDVKKNQISVEYQHPKHKQMNIDTGQVTQATEIHIRGALGRLEDILVGEHVRGEVLVEGKGVDRKLTVLKIYVDRSSD